MSPQELPLVCSLTAEDARGRKARWQALAASALIESHRIGAGAQQVYSPGVETERELRGLIALEAQCCAFLDFELSSDRSGLVLQVSGPPQAAPILDLFAGE